MSRVATANRCNDRHEIELEGGDRKVFFCQRQRGHRSYHQAHAVQWGRLWGAKDPTLPPPRRTGGQSSSW